MRPVQVLSDRLRHEMDRGRGGSVVYPFPVALEPGFSPFRHNHQPARSPFPEASNGAVRCSPVPPADLRFFKIRLSHQDSYNPGLSEQLLLALSSRYLISFEVMGLGGKVFIQMVAAVEDAANLANQLRSHYSHAQVIEGPDTLREAGTSSLLARSYRLRDSHLFQIRVEHQPESFIALAGILSSLGPNEVGLFQALFQRVRHPWPENILRLAGNPWDPGRSIYVDLPDLPRRARIKVEKPLFAVCVRVAASSPQLLSRLQGGFLSQFESGDNGLISGGDRYPVEAVLGRFTQHEGMLLSLSEVATLAHLPSPEAIPEARGVKRQC